MVAQRLASEGYRQNVRSCTSLSSGSDLLVHQADTPASKMQIDAAKQRQSHCNLKGKRVQFFRHYHDDQRFLADSVYSVSGGHRLKDGTGVRFLLKIRNGRCGFQYHLHIYLFREWLITGGLLSERLVHVQRSMLLFIRRHVDGVQTRAAEMLGISERVLRYKMKKADIKGR